MASSRRTTPIETCQEILIRFDAKRRETYRDRYDKLVQKNIMMCCREIANELNPPMKMETVHNIIMRLRPTTDMAKLYLKSKALKLAHRVVARANASEAMDILSRPGMGVLEPRKEVSEGGGGLFLSINAQDCGAVKVGIAQVSGPASTAELPAFDPFRDTEGESDESENAPVVYESPRALGAKDVSRPKSVIEQARERIKAAQRATHGDGDAQDTDDAGV